MTDPTGPRGEYRRSLAEAMEGALVERGALVTKALEETIGQDVAARAAAVVEALKK